MDPAILSATAGLIGSLVGGVSTFAASWLTQRGQLRMQTLVQQAVKREALYAEFIGEASKRVAEAWSHQAESPDAIAGLYAAVERMRLTSSTEVIAAAEEVIQQVIEAYAAPDLTFDDLRRSLRGGEFRDPLRAFSEACRAELQAVRA
jgi:tagatose-1,6-bisphosphate aldolase